MVTVLLANISCENEVQCISLYSISLHFYHFRKKCFNPIFALCSKWFTCDCFHQRMLCTLNRPTPPNNLVGPTTSRSKWDTLYINLLCNISYCHLLQTIIYLNRCKNNHIETKYIYITVSPYFYNHLVQGSALFGVNFLTITSYIYLLFSSYIWKHFFVRKFDLCTNYWP